MWRDLLRSVYGPLAATPFKTAPHPDRDASEKITRSGSTVESGRPLELSTLDSHHTKSEIDSSSKRILVDRSPPVRADSFKNLRWMHR
jgi:hypothetical protein